MFSKLTIVQFLVQHFASADARRFLTHANKPELIQQEYLLTLLRKNKTTSFGRKYGFEKIQSIQDFQSRVPILEYAEYQDYINEIAKGEKGILTKEAVLRLTPTSGTSDFNKFIPYTKSTIKEFNRALNVWISDLYHQYPAIKQGRAFWILSPSGGLPEFPSIIPVGFESDSAYFGTLGEKLIHQCMVLPPELKLIRHPENLQYLSALYLLSASDLTLISAWNPSYFLNLLAYIADHKDQLIDCIKTGNISLPIDNESVNINTFTTKPGKNIPRAEFLKTIIRKGKVRETPWKEIWPDLQLISCWTDGWAALWTEELVRLFENTVIQGKGLLATEGVVSIPVKGKNLPAYYSHFFEFIDQECQEIKLLTELKLNKTYSVIITTGSGLYRYPLHDLVSVISWYHKLPELKFLGKANIVVDLLGEKLSEQVVTTVLNSLAKEFGLKSNFLFLGPCKKEFCPFYTLYLEDDHNARESRMAILDFLDTELSKVFYYKQARDNQQLGSPELYLLNKDGVDAYSVGGAISGQASTIKFLSLDKRLNLFESLDGCFISPTFTV